MAFKSLTCAASLRFETRTMRFLNAYERGLEAREAVWATKRYRGHGVLPEKIMAGFDDQNM